MTKDHTVSQDDSGSGKEGWRCFQCGELFADAPSAAEHFTHSPSQPPACVRQLTDSEKSIHGQIARLEAHSHKLFLIKGSLEKALAAAIGPAAVEAAYAEAREILAAQPASSLSSDSSPLSAQLGATANDQGREEPQ